MKIDFSQNTLIITLYDKENIYHIWNTLEEMERMKKIMLQYVDECEIRGA